MKPHVARTLEYICIRTTAVLYLFSINSTLTIHGFHPLKISNFLADDVFVLFDCVSREERRKTHTHNTPIHWRTKRPKIVHAHTHKRTNTLNCVTTTAVNVKCTIQRKANNVRTHTHTAQRTCEQIIYVEEICVYELLLTESERNRSDNHNAKPSERRRQL